MAASLTISSAAVAADGRTITIAIGGATGAITPASGVTGFRVVAGSNTHTQASATISGTTLTIVLASFLSAGQTVTIDTVAGNLADSLGNTMVLATGQACTNNSTKNSTVFGVNNAAVKLAANTAFSNNFGRNQWENSVEPLGIDVLFTGTDVSIVNYAFYGGNLFVSIDGGAETTVAITATGVVAGTSWTETPVASGLSDAQHRLTIHRAFNQAALRVLDRDSGLRVAGAAPAITAPTSPNTGTDPVDTIYPIKQSGGLTVVDNSAAIRPDDNFAQSNATYYTGNGGTFGSVPGDFQFKATISTLRVFARRAGTFVLAIDGRPHAVLAPSVNNDLSFAWQTISTSLDATQEHTYRLTALTSSFAVYALDSYGGTGINLASLPAGAATVAFYGDSISQGFITTNIAYSHPSMACVRGGTAYMCAQRGVAGSTVIGTVSPSGDSAARVAQITGLARLGRVVILYGTNDVNAYYNAGGAPNNTYSAANFYTAYRDMLDKLSQAGTNSIRLDCLGILIPGWGAPQDALTPSYNTQIAAAVADMQATYPSKATLYRYIDTNVSGASFYPAGSGVHPSDAGSIILADRHMDVITQAMRPPSYGSTAAA